MKAEKISPRLLRTKQAAVYLGLSVRTIRNLAQQGQLPYVSEGNGSPWRFDLKDLERYIETHKIS